MTPRADALRRDDPDGDATVAADGRSGVWLALRHHAVPIGALVVAFVTIFARSLFVTRSGLFYVPWDFDSSYHRLLVYIGDCFRSGSFPLWNPYNAAGTPFFANPQSQIWSPITLLVAPLLGYTHDLAQRQLFLTVLFGGIGAYLLSWEIWRSRWAAFVTGACVALSSATFSNLEHLDIVNAFALLPWWFWIALRVTAGRRLAAPGMAFLLYWGITAGYPAVVAMGLLWLGAWFVHLTWTRCPAARDRLWMLARGAAAGLLALGLSAGHWIPVLATRTAFARGAPLDVDTALGNGLTPTHLWGLLFNFTTVTPFEGTALDVSMVGVFLGAIALPLCAVALMRDRHRLVRPVAFGAAGMLLMSLGAGFFGRVALHWLVPAFNVSRFPAADSRAGMVLCLALLAGAGARLLVLEGEARALAARLYRVTAIVLLLSLVALRVFAYPAMPQPEYVQRIVTGVTAQVVLVAAALLVLRRGVPDRVLVAVLGSLLLLDLGTDVVLNYRVVGTRVTPAERAARESAYVHRFDRAAAEVPRIVPDPPAPELQSEFSLVATTSKRFHLADYGAFRLTRFQELIAHGFERWLTNGARVVALPPDARPRTYAEFERATEAIPFRIASYGPNEVRYQVTATRPTLLAFNEVYFPGWRARVDGTPAPVIEIAGGLRGLQVGPGAHDIVTEFRPSSFLAGAAVAAASCATLLAWIAWSSLRRRRRDATPLGPIE